MAAEELFVTPTAISHHLRQLETWLGVRVLNRTPRSVTLTPEGKALYDVTASGFGEIAKVVTRLRGSESPRTLTLSSTTAFLNHWLAPRMGELRLLHPDIDLRLHASNAIVDLRSGGIEAAIRYGKGRSLARPALRFARTHSRRCRARVSASRRRRICAAQH